MASDPMDTLPNPCRQRLGQEEPLLFTYKQTDIVWWFGGALLRDVAYPCMKSI